MKISCLNSLLITAILLTSCQPEPPELSMCEREVASSSLTNTDKVVLKAVASAGFYDANYIISEPLKFSEEVAQNYSWIIDSTALRNAIERSHIDGAIGTEDIFGKKAISQSEYDCIVRTLEQSDPPPILYSKFSLPGYNQDSTEAILIMIEGSWQNELCRFEVYAKKENGVWSAETSPCNNR